MEMRDRFVKLSCEKAVSCFIENDMPNIAGLVIAGFAEFKTIIAESPSLDIRLKKIIISVVDISYGGDQGFS